MQSSKCLPTDSRTPAAGAGRTCPPQVWLRLYRRPGAFRCAQVLLALMAALYLVGITLFVLLGLHVLVWVLLLAGLAAGVTGLVITRSGTREQPVQPLLPTARADWVIAEEGVYARNSGSTILRPRSPLYQFFPWSSLSLEFISEKDHAVVLRHGGALLPLEVKDTPQLAYQTILAHLPDSCPTGRTRVAGFGWGLLIAGLLAGCLFWAGAAAWYDVLSAGKPGDGRCDFCGTAIGGWYTKAYGVAVAGELVHEYCHIHFMALGTLHPRPAAAYLLDALRAPRRNLGDVLLAAVPLIEAAALGWLYILVVVTLARPPWRRVARLRQ